MAEVASATWSNSGMTSLAMMQAGTGMAMSMARFGHFVEQLEGAPTSMSLSSAWVVEGDLLRHRSVEDARAPTCTSAGLGNPCIPLGVLLVEEFVQGFNEHLRLQVKEDLELLERVALKDRCL
ncbi:hypothetical protein EJB05_57134 [Eragrostis curvula]|uniref:Uncharacterized protein n=1 Tax=Eragrostis curvula TaxID=38414 RepID=A0A5J9SH48_9POAL|nr:hypothetical protein EJB05_57134 [Eragrostis curvula]